jgi:hypothetical protein
MTVLPLFFSSQPGGAATVGTAASAFGCIAVGSAGVVLLSAALATPPDTVRARAAALAKVAAVAIRVVLRQIESFTVLAPS